MPARGPCSIGQLKLRLQRLRGGSSRAARLAILEQRADIGLGFAQRGFDLAETSVPRRDRGSRPTAPRPARPPRRPARHRSLSADPLSEWAASFQSLSDCGFAQPLEIDHRLGAEQFEHLALERAFAERIAGQMHQIDRSGGRFARSPGGRVPAQTAMSLAMRLRSPSLLPSARSRSSRALRTLSGAVGTTRGDYVSALRGSRVTFLQPRPHLLADLRRLGSRNCKQYESLMARQP